MKDHYIPEDRFPIRLTPHVTLVGNYFFNLFLVTGRTKTALFETGISGCVDEVIRQLEGLEVSVDYLIPSHPHTDHITGLPGLMKRFPRAEILAAAGAKEFINHPKAGPLLVKEDVFMSRGLAGMGISPGRPALEAVPDLQDAQAIETAHGLDLGGVTLELKTVKGHSPGNLMGFIRKEKILFCSDSLGFHFPGRGFWPLFFTGAKDYLSTLEFIQGFDPDILCPGHQGPLEKTAAKKGILSAIDITLDTIRRIKDTRLSDGDLAREMFEQSYKDEFTLYTQRNIQNCTNLLIKRARESLI
ncbi:MAG: MBL fold metallo-hydrolase [Desulfobacteraceae bacterium]|nr:MBL fold metallo-hydrolase [Desulfobacteraceae bacterium]